MDKSKTLIGTMDDFHKIELEKIISATQTLYTTRVTVGSIVATVVFAILGTAFKSELTTITVAQPVSLFIAAALTFDFIVVDLYIKFAIASHYLRCLEIMRKFAIDDNNALSSIFAIDPKGQRYISDLLVALPDIRYKKLKNFGLNFKSLIGFWLPLVSAIADIIIGLLLIFIIIYY